MQLMLLAKLLQVSYTCLGYENSILLIVLGTYSYILLVHVTVYPEEVRHAYGHARNSVSSMQDQRGDGSRSAFLYLSCRAN